MRKASYITVGMLREKKACEVGITNFMKLFGDNVEVTKENCMLAASILDWDWAADQLLSLSARKAYNEARATAWKAYDEAEALAGKAYDEAGAAAWRAYAEAIALAGKAFDEAKALAFYSAFTGG